MLSDDMNFYGILGSIFSSKMTKTGSNTKRNLQNQGKASRPSPRCKKTRKIPKSEENEHFIVARWKLLAGQENRRINLKKICSSQYDATQRSTMT